MNSKLKNCLASIFASFGRALCTHNHFAKERAEDKDGVLTHSLVCTNCWKEFRIPEVLTRASGVFERIDDRIENQQKYEKLILSAQAYEKDLINNSIQWPI